MRERAECGLRRDIGFRNSHWAGTAWAGGAICLVICLMLSRVADGAIEYSILDLGPSGGLDGAARSINSSGTIVGTMNGTAFVYSNGVITALGTLGGSISRAYSINDAGEVVGGADSPSIGTTNGPTHAFVYTDGIMTDLGTLPGYLYSAASDINSVGQIVGNGNNDSIDYSVGYEALRAFIYSNGVMTDIGTLGGKYANALGINNAGKVVGGALTLNNAAEHAYLYSAGTMKDLGTLGGRDSYASRINNSGVIVGTSFIQGNAAYHAFIDLNGTMKDLSTFGGTYSSADDVNSAGQVVGYADIAPDSTMHAFLYSGGSPADLNNLVPPGSGWTLAEATGINDSGFIVGVGINPQNQFHTFLLSPLPEPATGTLLGVAFLAMVRRSRRRSSNGGSPRQRSSPHPAAA